MVKRRETTSEVKIGWLFPEALLDKVLCSPPKCISRFIEERSLPGRIGPRMVIPGDLFPVSPFP